VKPFHVRQLFAQKWQKLVIDKRNSCCILSLILTAWKVCWRFSKLWPCCSCAWCKVLIFYFQERR